MLILTKEHNESWLDAALRRAKPHGLENDVIESYHKHMGKKFSPMSSAYYACEDWDLLDFVEE